MDLLDCVEVTSPIDTQTVVEVNHSAGHARFREDGLPVPNMNLKCGGEQRKMRDESSCDSGGGVRLHEKRRS